MKLRLIQKQGSESPLQKKIIRAHNLAALFLNDRLSDISWSLSGKRYFTERFNEITARHSWCFIVGCNNSGTTVLKQLLEGAGTVSVHRYEGQLYTRVLKRDRDKAHVRVWMEYADELALGPHQGIEKGPRLLHDWMRALPRPVKEIIVEKTPANLLRMEWLQKVFPRSSFIGIVRNGYAVSEGIRRKGGQPLERGAAHWNAVNRFMLQKKRRISRFFLLKYEDLCDRPEPALRSLAPVIGIRENALINSLDRLAGEPESGRAAGLRLKNFNPDSISRLSTAQKKIIRSHASEMLDYFDYKD